MVVQVEVRHQESPPSFSPISTMVSHHGNHNHNDDDNDHEHINVVLIEDHERDDNNDDYMAAPSSPSIMSSSSMSRDDTLSLCRSVSLVDASRQTVDTQRSILDLTRDDDETDDEDDGFYDIYDTQSVMFEDLQDSTPVYEAEESKPLAPKQPTSSAAPTPAAAAAALTKPSLLDTFVDGLCPAENLVSPDTSCCSHRETTSNNNNKSNSINSSQCNSLACVPSQRLQIGTDVWNLLGCSLYPNETEMEEIWSLRTSQVLRGEQPQRPTRANIRRRMQRIRGLRMDPNAAATTRHGVTIQPHSIERSYTMDGLSSLRQYHHHHHQQQQQRYNIGGGQGMEPFLTFEEDGYDSDPELSSNSHSTRRTQTIVKVRETMPSPIDTPMLLSEEPCSIEEVEDQEAMIYDTVQQTLNTTWTLTWHPNADNVEEFGVPAKPHTINMWIERGTVISYSGVVVEPEMKWRDAYQGSLDKHLLNASTRNPWSTRLLNICRVAPLQGKPDPAYPLARPSCSLYLRTCHNQEFLLETSSPEEVEQLCESWKMTVARFASLAVTEDIDTIAKEFFHPTCNSQMLTVHDM